MAWVSYDGGETKFWDGPAGTPVTWLAVRTLTGN